MDIGESLSAPKGAICEFGSRKDLLCSYMGLATPTPLHVELYDHADCKDGPAEVSL